MLQPHRAEIVPLLREPGGNLVLGPFPGIQSDKY